ncbi:MAG: hypothetical protein JST86_19005 [Bacteroidetes bacterium]|nr:hypothetical protein [Bacteroidota bacterium]
MQPLPLPDFFQQQNKTGLSLPAFLQQVATEHPYFTPAHFFALQQMDAVNSNYVEQAAKTALLFNNPYWLQFQLEHAGKETTTEILPLIPSVAEVPENSDNDDDSSPVTVVAIAEQELPVTEETTTVVEEPGISYADNTGDTEENVVNDDDNAVMVSSEPVAAATAENTETEDDTAMKKQKEEIKIPLPTLKNTPVSNALPAFEPMHLVDYFASQGIKLTDDLQGADKLGKQLKSFTEWLKTMKKLHPADGGANAGAADIAVQVLAAKSNKEDSIITETMAEVLTQQGKIAKAVEMYEKLSLLNPAKSAFFAAKIEQLKGL